MKRDGNTVRIGQQPERVEQEILRIVMDGRRNNVAAIDTTALILTALTEAGVYTAR